MKTPWQKIYVDVSKFLFNFVFAFFCLGGIEGENKESRKITLKNWENFTKRHNDLNKKKMIEKINVS